MQIKSNTTIMGNGSSLEVVEGAETKDQKLTARQSFYHEFGQIIEESDYVVEDRPAAPQTEKSARTKKMSVAMGKTTNMPTVMKAKNMFKKPIALQKTPQKKLLIKKQDNQALLRQMYERMNPDVATANSKRVVGEVELAVKFRGLDSQLMIKVSRVKHLANKGISGLPDPYVQLKLFINGTKEPKETVKTKVVNNATSASFNEIFVFGISESDLPEAELLVEVLDRDMLTQDDFLGECRVQICDLDLIRGPMQWYQLLPQLDVNITGSMDVTLDFIEPDNLFITIHEARDVKAVNTLSNTSDPYTRISISGVPNKLETKVIENTCNPVWEERKLFQVAPEEFPRRTIILSVMDRETFNQDKRLGDVHIPLVDFNIHSADRKTYPLKDLRNATQARSKWTEEGLVMEFKEALMAHALYKCPKALFKKQHRGRMVVSLSSQKAQTQAKMVLANGLPDD